MHDIPRGHFSRSRPLAHYDANFGANAIADAIERRGAGAGTALLEIGCGEGRVLMELRKRFPAVELHGINRSPWSVMQGSQSLRETALHYGIFSPHELEGVMLPAIHFHDAAHLRFPDASMDVVISQVSIPYVVRKDLLLEDVWRVLRPGGIAFLQIDATRQPAADFLSGDTPTFVVYRNGARVPLQAVFADLRAQGHELAYGAVPKPGQPGSVRFNLVVRKNVARPLRLNLEFDPLSSFDLTRLHRSPADWGHLWGVRSVFHLRG